MPPGRYHLMTMKCGGGGAGGHAGAAVPSSASSPSPASAVRLLFLLVVAQPLLAPPYAEGKLCRNVDVRSRFEMLETKLRGCEIIVGDLQIVLLDQPKRKDFANVSFPELTEITGTLLIYQVYGLFSVGRLFPNLKYIHGNKQFHDYSLVIFRAPHLEEIALTNLNQIENGNMIVAEVPKLCYLDTIDWTKLGLTKNITKSDWKMPDGCSPCPAQCNGYCWNNRTCQTDGCKGDLCKGCMKYKSKCYEKCPAGTYELGKQYCISASECRKLQLFTKEDTMKCVNACPKFYKNGTNSSCVRCDESCVKVCNGTTVDKLSALQFLEGCTTIIGSLSIEGRDIEFKDSDLLYYLDQVKVITGSFKIHASANIKNLHFLSNLEKIGGGLTITDNADLNDLFLPNVTKNLKVDLHNGTLKIHYNPQLCLRFIKNFANATNMMEKYNDKDMVYISHLSNGEKAACNIIQDVGIRKENCTSNSIFISWNDFQNDNDTMGYFIYYAESSASISDKYNTGNDVCDNEWNSKMTRGTNITLTDLKPFTEYTYYITKFTKNMENRAETTLFKFTTLQDDPSPPEDVQVWALENGTVNISWSKPSELNGELWGYKLFIYPEYDNLEQARKPCEKDFDLPHVEVSTTLKKIEDNCDCSGKKFEDMCFSKSYDGNEIVDSCKEYTYHYISEGNRKRSASNNFLLESSKNYSFDASLYVDVPANATSYKVTGLDPYTLYIFLLTACNVPPKANERNPNDNKTYCSGIQMESVRTLKDESADVVSDLRVMSNDNTTSFYWAEPKRPNQATLAYWIQYNRTDVDKVTLQKCITNWDHVRRNGTFTPVDLEPGSYILTVQSVSLAGKSGLIETIQFEIIAPSNKKPITIGLSVSFAVLIIAGVSCYILYKRYYEAYKFHNLHMVASINPEYVPGIAYKPDKWEMERDDIVIIKELGTGSFGTVSSGLIKSKNLPCAVKTCKTNDRIGFLNEASVMKEFNSHHIIKLLGVVSKENPPMVIMELMAAGDLKTYLRKSRDSSNNITCIEMYKMAAEIADGMMYLASKKFVHRDLAARNCMLSEDKTVKIGDFGMTRDIYSTDYYRKGTKGLLPVRWMAPESLADGVFTSDSDVWSYGIVLWEMATLAEQPYQGLSNENVFQFVVAMGTLVRPPDCPDLLYEIMQACWKWQPFERPMFMDIVAELEGSVGSNFKLVSFYHSRDGEESRLNRGERVVNPPALHRIPEAGEEYVHWNASDDEEVNLY